MGLILSLETATTNCSVAIARDGKLLCLKEQNSKRYSHAENLHVFIREILRKKGYGLKDLDAVAVSKGPGSYTGLRIGVSTAKGLCFALDIPLISVETLKVLAQRGTQGPETFNFIIPMLEARRMEVYTTVFDNDLAKCSPTEAKVLSKEAYEEYLEQGKVLLVGNGTDKFKAICPHENATFHDEVPSAREMAGLADEKYKAQEFEDVAYFDPYYLKDFIAKKKE